MQTSAFSSPVRWGIWRLYRHCGHLHQMLLRWPTCSVWWVDIISVLLLFLLCIWFMAWRSWTYFSRHCPYVVFPILILLLQAHLEGSNIIGGYQNVLNYYARTTPHFKDYELADINLKFYVSFNFVRFAPWWLRVDSINSDFIFFCFAFLFRVMWRSWRAKCDTSTSLRV